MVLEDIKKQLRLTSVRYAIFGAVIASLVIIIAYRFISSDLSKSNIYSVIAVAITGLILLYIIYKSHKCEILICIFIIISATLCWWIHDKQEQLDGCYLLIAVVGIVALIIPLILSISSEHNFGSKLDSGEVRKSIVVSLTIVYIIFLVISFQQSLQPPSKSDGTYLAIFNVTTYGNASDQQDRMSVEINSTSWGILQVVPVTAVANPSNGTVQITPILPAKSEGEGGGGATIPLTSDNSTRLPTDAMNSFVKNFLWVYALIISFYFGSRILEDRADKSTFNDYMTKLIAKDKCPLDPLDIAKARFSLGEIGQREFAKLKQCLEEKPTVKIEEAYFKQAETDNEGNVTKKGHVILRIWNNTCKKIEVENGIINKQDKTSPELTKLRGIKLNQNEKRIILDEHDLKGKGDIISIQIAAKPVGASPTEEKYSALIMQDQIEEIKDA